MSTDATTTAESALLVARTRLHALGIPADDLPDDLVPVVAGGSLMPSLPGWTKRRARDWAALAIDRPVVARMMIDWADRNAGRLANLEWMTAWLTIAVPGLILSMGRRDFGPGEDFGRGVAETRDQVDLSGSARIDEMRVDGALDAVLARLNRIPRPWHAELTAAIAAARRGDRAPETELLSFLDGTDRPIEIHHLAVATELRVVPFDIRLGVQSRINAAPFCGAEPRELHLAGLRTERIDARGRPRTRLEYGFHFRPGARWDRFLDSDGAWREMVDHRGRSMFEPADFFELP